MHDPSIEAWEAGLNILMYLKGNSFQGLSFDGSNPWELIGFSDASWGSEPVPFGGFVIMLGGTAVRWAARKLKIVPQSSAEAEVAAYCLAAKELKFISNLLTDLHVPVVKPISIYCDNSAAIKIIKDVGAKARTRHFDRWLALGQEQYVDRFSKPVWIPTDSMLADCMTKSLDKTKFLAFRAGMTNTSHDHVPMLLRHVLAGGKHL